MIRRVEVSGYAEVTTKPETVEIGISVGFRRGTPHEAEELTARTTGKVLAELREIGVEEDEIKTRRFHIRPVYEWEKDSRVFKGYEGSNELKIETTKLHLLGSILTSVVKAGAKEIRYVSFGCRDRKALELNALEKAAENARLRAEAIAAGLGMKVGPIVRISDKCRSYPGNYVLAEASPAYKTAEANVIIPEDIKETAQVDAVFEIVED